MKYKILKMNKISIKNKKAFFNYEVVETEIAGLILVGTEVKSVVEGNISFTDSYCDFINNELWLINFHISEFKKASAETHDPKRNRKLLLTKQQIRKFKKKFDEKGLTIVPLNIFTDKRGLIKMEIGLVRGKKQYDKKENIKERDLDRETQKILKNYQ
jgi:SsrA-binding protein